VSTDPPHRRRRAAPRVARASTRAAASRPRSNPTRVKILKAAAEAFRRVGFHGATMEEIAAALDMKKGNLYYYFPTKEDILFACHQYSLDRLLAVLEDVERTDQPPDRKLRTLIVAFVHTIIDDLHGAALFMDLEALTPAHQRQAIAGRDRFDRGVRHVIEQGIDWGTFAPHVDPKLVSFAMLGAVNWIPRWYNPAGPATSQQIAEHFAAYLVDGLRSI
jgi:AcrR family transcriptional regulator